MKELQFDIGEKASRKDIEIVMWEGESFKKTCSQLPTRDEIIGRLENHAKVTSIKIEDSENKCTDLLESYIEEQQSVISKIYTNMTAF